MHHARHKPCWKSMHHVSWLWYYSRNYSTRKYSHKKRKHSHSKVSYDYPGSPTQADHISRRSQYSHVFCKPFLLVMYRNKVFLYFHFSLKSKKQNNNEMKKLHPLFFDITWSIEIKYNIIFMYDTYATYTYDIYNYDFKYKVEIGTHGTWFNRLL